MTKPFHPLPAAGDIVWCRFPEEANKPASKMRPALVIAVSNSTHEIEIAYGTTQKLNRIYPSEFALHPGDKGFTASGLSFATKFDLGNTVKVPFDDMWFAPNPAGIPVTHQRPKKLFSIHKPRLRITGKPASRRFCYFRTRQNPSSTKRHQHPCRASLPFKTDLAEKEDCESEHRHFLSAQIGYAGRI